MTQLLSQHVGRRPSRSKSALWDISNKVSEKTQGEIEGAVCEWMTRFEREYMGRGPTAIRAYLIGDLLVVRLRDVLTVAEQQLIKILPAEKGRELLKQVRTQLVEAARPVLEAMVTEITGAKVLSLHHDISSETAEEVVLFTLVEPPCYSQTKTSRARASCPPATN